MRNMLNVLFLIETEEHRINSVNRFPIIPVVPVNIKDIYTRQLSESELSGKILHYRLLLLSPIVVYRYQFKELEGFSPDHSFFLKPNGLYHDCYPQTELYTILSLESL